MVHEARPDFKYLRGERGFPDARQKLGQKRNVGLCREENIRGNVGRSAAQ